MQGGIHRAVVQDFCRAAPQSADYGFSSIVIERDPANHWRNSRDEPREPWAREFAIVP